MATFHKRTWTNGQQPAINDTNLNALESDIQTFGNDILEEAGTDTIQKLGYDQYSNSNTYAIDDYCIYNDTIYKCIVAITTPEDFNSAKWSATTIKQMLSEIETNISTNTSNIATVTNQLGNIHTYRVSWGTRLEVPMYNGQQGILTIAGNIMYQLWVGGDGSVNYGKIGGTGTAVPTITKSGNNVIVTTTSNNTISALVL